MRRLEEHSYMTSVLVLLYHTNRRLILHSDAKYISHYKSSGREVMLERHGWWQIAKTVFIPVESWRKCQECGILILDCWSIERVLAGAKCMTSYIFLARLCIRAGLLHSFLSCKSCRLLCALESFSRLLITWYINLINEIKIPDCSIS